MNVSEIRQRIYDQMDFNPDLQQYRDSVVRRINDQYERVCDLAHWLFLQKEGKLQLRANITNDGGTVSADETVFFQVETNNHRRILAADLSSYFSSSPPAVASTLAFTGEMEGQTLIDEDSNEYTIVAVKSSTEMFIEPSWKKSTAADITNFTIRFDRYALPNDCIEVLGMVDRDDDRGRLPNIDRKRTEIAYLDRDTTGEPLVSIEDESFIDQSPISTPTAADGTTSGSGLVAENKYEYMYTIFRDGRESPPSSKVQHTLGSTGTEVVLSNFDDTRWFSTTNSYDSGILKYVYRRDVTNNGRWILITTLAAATTTYTDTTLVPTTAFQFQQNSAYKYSTRRDIVKWQDPGPRQHIRFWYVPSTDRIVHLRYHRRPQPLVADTDSPEIPRQYHMILVYLTLEDMFLQMQDQGQGGIFRVRGDEMIKQMRRRYLSRDDTRKKFARWDRPTSQRVVGDVTGDFLGADSPY